MDCFGSDIGVRRTERIANARLIAAAPDLLAALDRLAAGGVDVSNTAIIVGNGADTLLRQIRAAVAKARGAA